MKRDILTMPLKLDHELSAIGVDISAVNHFSGLGGSHFDLGALGVAQPEGQNIGRTAYQIHRYHTDRQRGEHTNNNLCHIPPNIATGKY